VFAFVAPFDFYNPLFQLSNNIPNWQPARWAKAAVVAKGTSSQGYGAIYVGASETGVKRNTLDSKTVNLLEIIAITEISVAICPPIQIVPVKLVMLHGLVLRIPLVFGF
jgi:hypothetical protein